MTFNNRYFKSIFAIAFLIIVALNLILWIYLNNVENDFSNSLKSNLISENKLIAKILDVDFISAIIPGEINSLQYISVLQNLGDIRKQNALQSVTVVSLSGDIVVSSPEILTDMGKTIQYENPYFKQALSGIVLTSEMEHINGEYFISSYGPLKDIDETIIAVLVTEVKANYFDTINSLRNRFLIYSFSTITAIIMIAFILFRLIDKTLQYQSTIKEHQHLAQLGTLGATVAHEIRNPLGIIEGSHQLIQKKYGHKDDELFDFIPGEIKRLSEIIDSFLNYARTPKQKISDFPLSSLLDRIRIGIPKAHDGSLTINEETGDIILSSNFNLLEQALLNVIINAFESADKKFLVTLTVSTKGKNVIFEISDNGPGINADDLANIFKPFFTTKDKGTGLGLAVTKRIIDILSGEISVESHINIGTIFIITIPKFYRESPN